MGRIKAKRAARKSRKRTGRSTGENIGKTSTGTGAAAEDTGAESSGVRVLPVNNDAPNRVEVDEARIAAEMEAAAARGESETSAAAPGTAPDDAPVTAEPQPSTWAPICPGVVSVVDTFVMPNWKLTAEEKDTLTEALAPVLDDLFPGGIGSERWAPYFRLVFVCGGIVMTRWNRDEGLPPLHAEPNDNTEKGAHVVQGEAAASSAAQ